MILSPLSSLKKQRGKPACFPRSPFQGAPLHFLPKVEQEASCHFWHLQNKVCNLLNEEIPNNCKCCSILWTLEGEDLAYWNIKKKKNYKGMNIQIANNRNSSSQVHPKKCSRSQDHSAIHKNILLIKVQKSLKEAKNQQISVNTIFAIFFVLSSCWSSVLNVELYTCAYMYSKTREKPTLQNHIYIYMNIRTMINRDPKVRFQAFIPPKHMYSPFIFPHSFPIHDLCQTLPFILSLLLWLLLQAVF